MISSIWLINSYFFLHSSDQDWAKPYDNSLRLLGYQWLRVDIMLYPTFKQGITNTIILFDYSYFFSLLQIRMELSRVVTRCRPWICFAWPASWTDQSGFTKPWTSSSSSARGWTKYPWPYLRWCPPCSSTTSLPNRWVQQFILRGTVIVRINAQVSEKCARRSAENTVEQAKFASAIISWICELVSHSRTYRTYFLLSNRYTWFCLNMAQKSHDK